MGAQIVTAAAGELGVAALVALVVSAFTTGLVKFFFDETLASRKAARDYSYDRRRELHALVGRFDGRLLESAADFFVRIGNVIESADPVWLVPKQGMPPGYFLSSTVYRFVALMRLAVAFDREAIYFDPEIASRHDLLCIKYAKSMQWAMTDMQLFDGIAYDSNESGSHFFRDILRTRCTIDLPADQALTYEHFCESVLPSGDIDDVVEFFSGFGPETTPLRWDRVMALQLLLAAFVDRIGFDEEKEQPVFDEIARQIVSPVIRSNLIGWFEYNIGSVDREGTKKILGALKKAETGVEQSPA